MTAAGDSSWLARTLAGVNLLPNVTLGANDPRLNRIDEWRRRTGRDVRMTRLETERNRVRVREVSPTGVVLAERILRDGEDPIDAGLDVAGLSFPPMLTPAEGCPRWHVRLDDPLAERPYDFKDIAAVTAGDAKARAARLAIMTDAYLHAALAQANDREAFLATTAQYAVIVRCAPA